MDKDYFISLYLDTRRAKSNGKYPLKLRVFTSSPRKQKLYPTNFEFTEKDFDSIWNTTKPRNEYKQTRRILQAIENRAIDVAEKIAPFVFEEFERKLLRKPGDGILVSYHYKERIQELLARSQISTANIYKLSERSIQEFVESFKMTKYEKLALHDVDKNWLQDYEQYMTQEKGRSLNTVGIYLRVFKAVFNNAIQSGDIEQDYYPFGKRKYQVPSQSNVKKALSREQLVLLYNAEAANSEQEKARSFWFFSYAASGMNVKDIALLRFKDIKKDRIEFIRAKTKRTSKSNLRTIIVPLTEITLKTIEKYGNPNESPQTFVFPILNDKMNLEEQQKRIKAFTRFINQHIKKLCKAIGLPEEVSTYWARHSFATNAVRSGASMEFVQESLGHESLKTTQSYFAGFGEDARKKILDALTSFK